MTLLIADGQIHTSMNTNYYDYFIAQMEENLYSNVLDSIKKINGTNISACNCEYMNPDNTNISDKFSSKKFL